jgi:hypothetical protein
MNNNLNIFNKESINLDSRDRTDEKYVWVEIKETLTINDHKKRFFFKFSSLNINMDNLFIDDDQNILKCNSKFWWKLVDL